MSVHELQDQLAAAKRQVVTDGYEMSLGEIASLYRANELIIDPIYQRLVRWEDSQKTRFIESILLGIPVPPIFVFQREDGVWELIDGLQRISTVLHLMGILVIEGDVSPPLELAGTNLLPALDGMKWSGESGDEKVFSIPLQLEIKRARMRVEILRKESDQDTKYELFQRLNTGGSRLSEQEVRNCVMVMLNREFYDWINKLASTPNFLLAVQLTESQMETAQDCEMALRFIAYRNFPYQRGLDVNEYLDHASRALASMPKDKRGEEQVVFEWTFELLSRVAGAEVLKRWDGVRHTGRSLLAAFDAIAYGVSMNMAAISEIPEAGRDEWVLEKIRGLWTQPIFEQHGGSGVRGTTRLVNLLPFGVQYFKP